MKNRKPNINRYGKDFSKEEELTVRKKTKTTSNENSDKIHQG